MELFWIFIVSTVFLWPSLFIISLLIFRQNILAFIHHIILCSILMACITTIIHICSFQSLIAVIQLFFLILCFICIFKIRIFPSFLMSVITYLLASLEEAVLYLIVSNFNSELFVTYAKKLVVLPALFIGGCNYALSFLLFKKRIGFSFLSFHHYQKSKSIMENKLKYYAVVASFYISMLSITLFHFEKWISLSLLAVLIVFLLIIFYLYIKDSKED